MAGRQLEILAIQTAVRVLVLDPHVRELHALLHDRQAVRVRPRADLFRRSIRPSRAVAGRSIPLLQEALVVPLQLVVHDDPADPATACVQPLRRLGVDARELRIMRGFARLGQARVEHLGLLARCGLTMLFEH